LWFHSLKVAQLLRSAACLHINQSRSYLNHLVLEILCFVDRASQYNLVNKADLVHNLFLVCLFLVYLSIYTCFGRLRAHHQEKQLCLYYTWYLLFCVDDCLVWRVDSTLHTRQSSTQNNKYQVSHKHSCFS